MRKRLFPIEERHESMRGYFAHALFKEMEDNENVWLLTADLGYKMFDKHFKHFPDRVKNCGASEQAMLGVAVGLSLRGKVVVCYSITNFILYRPFEFIRNYIDHDKIKVILVGAGRDDDYKEDGWTHQSPDAQRVLDCFPSIRQYFPESKEEAPIATSEAFELNGPSFISLRRK